MALLLCHSALGIDCARINHPECQPIQESNLTDKDELSINLLYLDGHVPDHPLVEDWNLAIQVDEAPEDTGLHSSWLIKDAWVRILAVMPSVQAPEGLYVYDSASILSGFNHKIEMPFDYNSPGYPVESHGDCRRLHYLTQNQVIFKVFDKGVEIGHENYFLREFNNNANLNAQYNVQASILVRHYRWELRCCMWRWNRCIKYCAYCEENRLQNRQDQLIVWDYLNLTYYQSQELPGFKVVNRQQGTTYARIKPSKANAQISSEKFTYEHYPWHYSLSYNHKPYYFLTIKAKPINQTILRNAYLDEDILVFPDQECTKYTQDFFSGFETQCNMEYNALNLSLRTDKLSYREGEEILVEISPEDLLVNVSYANETISAIGTVSFTAIPHKNIITARHEEAEVILPINVKTQNYNLIILLGSFSTVSYVFYLGVKKYWGGLI